MHLLYAFVKNRLSGGMESDSWNSAGERALPQEKRAGQVINNGLALSLTKVQNYG